MKIIYFIAIILIFLVQSSSGLYTDPNCDGKQVIVHLFEWKWTEVAAECEIFLSKSGYCGVQVSPVNEHVVVLSPHRPWWESYQPVSYKLSSRRGNETEFISMVQRCNAVGIRIYVDVLMNHMAAGDRHGNGSAGSYFDATRLSFPAVPYSREHFTPRYMCPSNNGDVNDYTDARNIRNCNLVALTDLYLSLSYVRQKLIDFLNKLIRIGVTGFRLDAAKHMWPNDIKAIQNGVADLPSGSRPFFFSEVIDNGGEAISAQEYTESGYVTEFRYGKQINNAVRSFDKFRWLVDPTLNMLDSKNALVFVDNHDNQRNEGAGSSILTYKQPNMYKMAVTFTLAYDYGFVRVISSYNFSNFDDGPPHNNDDTIKNVKRSADGSCTNGWVCEHRWPQIANMVEFRNKMAGLSVQNYMVSSGIVSFSRGQKGFFVMSKSGILDRWIYTGLPAGHYCDIISGCSRILSVDGNGRARVVFWSEQEPVMAFMVGGKKPRSTIHRHCRNNNRSIHPLLPSLPRRWKRTVILIKVETQFGQNVFLRGGIDHSKRSGCTNLASTSQCAIPIRHRTLGTSAAYVSFNTWAKGEEYVDWFGKEPKQFGRVNGKEAEGTPLLWTTDDETSGSYSSFNTYGPNYWLLDVDMFCSKSYNGWFEFKALIDNNWEGNIPTTQCSGASSYPSYTSSNHFARCGYLNVFQWNQGDCLIMKL